MPGPRAISVARVAARVQAAALAIVALIGLGFAIYSGIHDLNNSGRQLAGVGEVIGGFAFVLFGCSALLIWLPTRRLSRERAAAIILVLAEVLTGVLVVFGALQSNNTAAKMVGVVYALLALLVLGATIASWPEEDDQ